MQTHEEMKQEALARPEVKAAWDALADEYALLREMLHARQMAGLTQADVAAIMQTKAPAIARLEAGGKHSPSLSTLRKYAAAVNCTLELKLVPRRAV